MAFKNLAMIVSFFFTNDCPCITSIADRPEAASHRVPFVEVTARNNILLISGTSFAFTSGQVIYPRWLL